MKNWITTLVLCAALASCGQGGTTSPETFPQNGWLRDSTGPDPVITMISGGSIKFNLECKESSLNIQARDITPANQFPQPNIVYKFGDTNWEARPVASNIGSQAVLYTEIYQRNNVMGARKTLAWLRDSHNMTVEFLGQTRSTDIPSEVAKWFSAACEKRWGLPK